MSIRVMTMVWDSTIPAPERFTLLALADWASEDGGHIYPSVATLARKCALSERSIQYHIRQLEEMGVLVVDRPADKEARRSSRYVIQIPVLRRMVHPEDDPTAGGDRCRSCTGADLAPVQDATGTGAESAPYRCRSCTLSVIEPSREPSEERASAPSLREDVAALCQRMMERLDLLEIARPKTDHPSGYPPKWIQQARLLLDVDKRELQKALNLLDWATVDVFWSANIHGIPTFRKQYEKLRIAALKDHNERKRAGLHSVPTQPPASFEALVEAADVETARRLIKRNYLMPDHMPDNPMTYQAWRRHCAREWITQHEAPIRAALEDRKAQA